MNKHFSTYLLSVLIQVCKVWYAYIFKKPTSKVSTKSTGQLKINTYITQADDTLEDCTFENMYAISEYSEDIQTISVSIAQSTKYIP